MATDIPFHCFAERRTAHGWESCPLDYGDDGYYEVFAMLAGVNRGGGVPPLEPIVPPRGFPADSPVVGRLAGQPGDDLRRNATWLTLKELLEFPWRERMWPGEAYVDAENYLHYRIDGRPRFAHYVGPLPGSRVVGNETMERYIREGRNTDGMLTLVPCGIPYAELADPFLSQVLPLLDRLGAPEDVRLVLSFRG